jgi:hypothetical protein
MSILEERITTRVRRILYAVFAAAWLVQPVAARPGARDPTVPHRVRAGPPAGFWPMYRGDGARSGRAKVPFPTSPVVVRRLPLSADLATSPVADAQGHLVVATKDGKLVERLSSGAVVFTLTLDAPAVQGPVIESNGTRLVVTREGVAIGVSADGAIVFTTPLAMARGSSFAEPVATRDGAAIVALGSRVTKLGADGGIRATAELDEAVAAITETETTIYLATETGRVVGWMPPDSPHPLGNLGGKPTGALVAVGDTSLAAVVRGANLVQLDARDGTRATLASLAPDSIADSPALLPGGELRFTTRAGWLLGYAEARETFRRATTPAGSVPAFAFSDGALAPLVDPAGVVAFITPAANLGISLPTGDVHSTSVPECGPPVAMIPAGSRLLAVFCRGGFVALIGERPSSSHPEKPGAKPPVR